MLAAARPDSQLERAGAPLPRRRSPHAARDVALALDRRGACFFQDLVASTRRLPAEVEDALWELLARGLVSADAVDNLRVLQSPKRRKRQKALRRGGPGRWSLLRPLERYRARGAAREARAQLLGRYGILFRDLAVREPLCPSWRELLFVLRRLEARGEIRGGRFLAGFAGEQFALPEAVDVARSMRRQAPSGKRVRALRGRSAEPHRSGHARPAGAGDPRERRRLRGRSARARVRARPRRRRARGRGVESRGGASIDGPQRAGPHLRCKCEWLDRRGCGRPLSAPRASP